MKYLMCHSQFYKKFNRIIEFALSLESEAQKATASAEHMY